MMNLPQRVLLASWGVGLVLVPLKLVGFLDTYSWPEVTFPLWGGTGLFFAWGLLESALSGKKRSRS